MNTSADPTPPAAAGGASPACGTTTPCPLQRKVVTIAAKVPGTKGLRVPANQLPENTLASSSSPDETLAGNAPVILVRGCLDVTLAATTTPPDLPVTWQIKPNENSGAAPTLTPINGGKGATLKTDKTGSFSVIATLDASKVVWNVVFVWVKVLPDTSVVTKSDAFYAGTGPGGFESGDDSHFPWQAKVKVQVIGGKADGSLGIEKVPLHILQNGIDDTMTGHYDGGGTALEVPFGGLPVRDSNGPGVNNFWGDDPETILPDNVGKDREIWTADPPAGSFPLTFRDVPGGKALKTVTGVNKFRTAIASISLDAPNAVVVHADTVWSADYSGKFDAAGNYTVNGAHTTADAKFKLIAEASGGADAQVNGYEIFEPRFNGGTDTKWTP